MALNLSYDPSEDPDAVAAFEAEEAEALALGERMYQEAEDGRQQVYEDGAAQEAEEAGGLFAGKFLTTQDLEQAYLSLQQKLGRGESLDDGEEGGEVDESTAEGDESDEAADDDGDEAVNLFDVIAQELEENDYISDELSEVLKGFDPSDIVSDFIEFRQRGGDSESGLATQELTTEDITAFQDLVGGPQEYQQMTSWAAENLAEGERTAYDRIMLSGNPESIYFAVQAINARYRAEAGDDGRLVEGRTRPSRGVNGYRSMAELVRAMEDPRYDSDYAYRQDVEAKVARSNL
jgi:hypothetical protein